MMINVLKIILEVDITVFYYRWKFNALFKIKAHFGYLTVNTPSAVCNTYRCKNLLHFA